MSASAAAGRPWNAAGVFWNKATCQAPSSLTATSDWIALVARVDVVLTGRDQSGDGPQEADIGAEQPCIPDGPDV